MSTCQKSAAWWRVGFILIRKRLTLRVYSKSFSYTICSNVIFYCKVLKLRDFEIAYFKGNSVTQKQISTIMIWVMQFLSYMDFLLNQKLCSSRNPCYIICFIMYLESNVYLTLLSPFWIIHLMPACHCDFFRWHFNILLWNLPSFKNNPTFFKITL